MAILTQAEKTYYLTGGEHGNYRHIPLTEIIDSFAATYVGEGKLCDGVILSDITFHAIRSLQELSYDTLRCTKDWEVEIPSTLVLVMPVDYINYVKLSWSDSNGIERIIYPTSKTSNPRDVNHTVTDFGGFDTSALSTNDDLSTDEDSTTWANYKTQTASDIGSTDADEVDDEYGQLVGGRYGIDPQYAQGNGSFFIDESAGKFHFSSNISGKTVILRYISDGVATNATNNGIDLSLSLVPKLAEEAIYKHILYGVLSARANTPPSMLQVIKKERFAETRKAKLRLSNLKIEELTQILRGSSKIIKH
tara:strand:+ start:719 stop:1639 length:921 start_codon:yes stop_codon:yes gene_type:complete